ncbi:hypothetical protein MRX96_004625 [Rhipicephalus microplus]
MRTHTGEKLYKCKQCPYSSASSSSLVCHMRNHTGDKPYACAMCPYLTSRYCDIVERLRTHTGDKSFKWDQCAYAFTSQSTLNIAESSSMPSQKDAHFYWRRTVDLSRGAKSAKKRFYTTTSSRAGAAELLFCHLCPFTTRAPHGLKSHMLVHTGERRFECMVCSVKFAHKSTLKRHMRTHTGEKPYKCDLCPYRAADCTSLDAPHDKPYWTEAVCVQHVPVCHFSLLRHNEAFTRSHG